ncbi:hypothetical protein GLOIN_2v1781474 [Rhizophagus clarus]|uniref:Bromo domain-containing protein n=1 Tax=Rhizophagus clarus TaxID=94130 RepID=A0A8H3LFK5_9GLOM|nr:hypothetical protein GLOIN_2v1781474 [Rhizophagus clarus]
MNTTTENYIGYEALVSYLSESKNNWTYKGFLNLNRDAIIASLTSLTNSPLTLVKWQNFNITWYNRFLSVAKEILEPNAFTELKKKVYTEHSRYPNKLQTFWEEVIKEYEKENLVSAVTTSISLPKKTRNIHKDFKYINFCYNILYELENTSYANPFFKYIEKNITNKAVKHPMDLVTINSKLENSKYIELEEDIHLIFRNCYTYNDVGSEAYHLGEVLESIFNKKWNEKLIHHDRQIKKRARDNDTDSDDIRSKTYHLGETLEFNKKWNEKPILQDKQTRELKRVRDNNINTDDILFKKQIQIFEQNKDKLVYRQIINNGLLVASAYENLVADEPVLQAIVESLLPLKYCVPELSLIMDGKKQKGSGRFGYSDIFVLKEIAGDNNISLELKYISLVDLMKNQKIKFGANDLENLDKIVEKEDEDTLLKRVYTYWSNEHKETKQITISEVLNNGINQLKSYINIISKGKPASYSSSGVFDKRIRITESNPNKLKGFVILVVGFHRILWRSVEEHFSPLLDFCFDFFLTLVLRLAPYNSSSFASSVT